MYEFIELQAEPGEAYLHIYTHTQDMYDTRKWNENLGTGGNAL